MNGLTLANVFDDPERVVATAQLFDLEDLQQAASLAAAVTVEDTRGLVDSLVANAAGQLLDVSIGDIMLGAWAKLRELQQFATGEKLESDQTHKFVLSEHRITSKHAPKIALFVYEKKVKEVTVDIVLTLVIAKTNLFIKQGRIVEVRISGCQAMGKLSCRGQTILEKKSAELEFPPVIKLGKGIKILPPLKRKAA